MYRCIVSKWREVRRLFVNLSTCNIGPLYWSPASTCPVLLPSLPPSLPPSLSLDDYGNVYIYYKILYSYMQTHAHTNTQKHLSIHKHGCPEVENERTDLALTLKPMYRVRNWALLSLSLCVSLSLSLSVSLSLSLSNTHTHTHNTEGA